MSEFSDTADLGNKALLAFRLTDLTRDQLCTLLPHTEIDIRNAAAWIEEAGISWNDFMEHAEDHRDIDECERVEPNGRGRTIDFCWLALKMIVALACPPGEDEPWESLDDALTTDYCASAIDLADSEFQWLLLRIPETERSRAWGWLWQRAHGPTQFRLPSHSREEAKTRTKA